MLILALTLSWCASGHQINQLALGQAIGSFTEMEGQSGWIVPIPRQIIADINSGRKLLGRPRNDPAEVNRLPWVNSEYISDALLIIESEIREGIDAPPEDMQVFYGFLLGVKALKTSGWSPQNVDSKKTLLKWKAYNELKAMLTAAKPPPLPTDGRKPIPTRMTVGTRKEQ